MHDRQKDAPSPHPIATLCPLRQSSRRDSRTGSDLGRAVHDEAFQLRGQVPHAPHAHLHLHGGKTRVTSEETRGLKARKREG